MDFEKLLAMLRQHLDIITSLTTGLTVELARWKPSPDTWSILEVLNHLYDEEREDFRTHLDQALYHPEQPWHEIHPFAWVTERGYNERDLATTLHNFREERQASLDWLVSLKQPDWEAVIHAPFGDIRAGDLFASWIIHDQWHIQQLIRLRRAYTMQQIAPYSAKYAGTL